MSFSVPAVAWNDRGHMTVAAVAWDQLTPRARNETSRLLRMNPAYHAWISNVPSERRDQIAFIRAATWPDSIRSIYRDDGFDPLEPGASQNVGYADRLVHRYWHYKDIAFSPDGTNVKEPPSVNAVSRIQVFNEALADPTTSDDIRSFDLSWLLHLVGDIHQPMHSAERYTSSFRHGDSGGNGVKICMAAALSCGTGDDLHKFWDGAIGNSRDPMSAIIKARTFVVPEANKVMIDDPEVWAEESFELARSYAYAAPIGASRKTYKLTVEYQRNAGSIAEQRVALAGYRLAHLLNGLYL